ncbi:hypothetical protein FQN57_000707 [Myotisia sp. PD_48]|nr:hypothetical protein FQN57_000707 [Myotisia sp. PD_48]
MKFFTLSAIIAGVSSATVSATLITCQGPNFQPVCQPQPVKKNQCMDLPPQFNDRLGSFRIFRPTRLCLFFE